MEAFGEYRVGHNQTGHKHWIECRGEIISQVVNAKSGQGFDEEVVWHYRPDETIIVKSEIPGWAFEGSLPSIGHCLVELARSHRQFIEPNRLQRLCREMALWPLWGKVAAAVFLLGALAEVLRFLRSLYA